LIYSFATWGSFKKSSTIQTFFSYGPLKTSLKAFSATVHGPFAMISSRKKSFSHLLQTISRRSEVVWAVSKHTLLQYFRFAPLGNTSKLLLQ
jgi:hypothetical protein